MGTQARVSSIEALESFRAALILFVGKGRRSLDDVGDEVRRTRQWLQFEQRTYWQGELRRRTKALQQAQQELSSARFSGHQESAAMARQATVNRAQRALAEVEDKLKKVKGWSQNFDHAVDPVYKRIGGLQHVLDHDLPKAIIYLASVQRTLADYAQTAAPTDATDFVMSSGEIAARKAAREAAESAAAAADPEPPANPPVETESTGSIETNETTPAEAASHP
jgi:hypothetical protein